MLECGICCGRVIHFACCASLQQLAFVIVKVFSKSVSLCLVFVSFAEFMCLCVSFSLFSFA